MLYQPCYKVLSIQRIFVLFQLVLLVSHATADANPVAKQVSNLKQPNQDGFDYDEQQTNDAKITSVKRMPLDYHLHNESKTDTLQIRIRAADTTNATGEGPKNDVVSIINITNFSLRTMQRNVSAEESRQIPVEGEYAKPLAFQSFKASENDEKIC
jgi:hypothetical protein